MGQPNGSQSGADGVQSDPNADPNAAPANTDPNAVPPVTDPAAQSGTPRTYTQAEVDAINARLSAADKNRETAQKALKAIEDAKLTEAERTKNALAEAETKLKDAEEKAKEGLLDNAILLDTTYDWHDRTVVLQQIDRAGLTFSDDGKVTGVKVALDKLAKDKPFLLKPKGDGGDGGGSTNSGTGGQTGAPGTTRQHGKGTDEAALAKKWPGMRGRVPID